MLSIDMSMFAAVVCFVSVILVVFERKAKRSEVKAIAMIYQNMQKDVQDLGRRFDKLKEALYSNLDIKDSKSVN